MFVLFSVLKLKLNYVKVKHQKIEINTAWKESKYGFFSGPHAGIYRPENTPYLDTFHAVQFMVT